MKQFIISEQEKRKILDMHRSATKRNYLFEDTKAPEPLLTFKSATFLQYLKIGSSGPLDETKKQNFLNASSTILKNSDATIRKFYNNTEYKIPKFIKIIVGTDATGSEKDNTTVAQKRLAAAKKLVKEAFTNAGLGYNDTKIESWITSSQNYNPSSLDKNLYDPNKKGDRPGERYIKIIITQLTTEGLTTDQITDVEHASENAYSDFFNINIDEPEIATQMCKLKTFSDITDLNGRFNLQSFLNSKLYDSFPYTYEKERNKIKACLNKASQASGKGDVAQLVGDKFTIDLNK